MLLIINLNKNLPFTDVELNWPIETRGQKSPKDDVNLSTKEDLKTIIGWRRGCQFEGCVLKLFCTENSAFYFKYHVQKRWKPRAIGETFSQTWPLVWADCSCNLFGPQFGHIRVRAVWWHTGILRAQPGWALAIHLWKEGAWAVLLKLSQWKPNRMSAAWASELLDETVLSDQEWIKFH